MISLVFLFHCLRCLYIRVQNKLIILTSVNLHCPILVNWLNHTICRREHCTAPQQSSTRTRNNLLLSIMSIYLFHIWRVPCDLHTQSENISTEIVRWNWKIGIHRCWDQSQIYCPILSVACLVAGCLLCVFIVWWVDSPNSQTIYYLFIVDEHTLWKRRAKVAYRNLFVVWHSAGTASTICLCERVTNVCEGGPRRISHSNATDGTEGNFSCHSHLIK